MKRKLLLATLALLMLSGTSHSQALHVLTEDYKPFQYIDKQGELAGFGIELITLIFKDAGIKIKGDEIQMYPWARVYGILQKEENTAVFMTVRTAKRENLFKWVGPLAPRKMWFFKLRKRKDIQINTLEDVKQYTIGGYKESADTLYMIELGLDPDIIPHQRLLTKMLVNERFDIISSLELTMAARLRDMGLSYDIVEKTILLDGRYDYYLAISKKTPDALVDRLQNSFEKIRADGTYDRLMNRWLK